MSLIYEIKKDNVKCVRSDTPLQYPAHFHYHIEMVKMTKGAVYCFTDANKYTVSEGDLFISFPNQIHQHETVEREKYVLLIVNPDMIPELASFFKDCFLNTIETTVTKLDDGGYFVITGDIPAMWLRDSAAQLTHYIRYANEDEDLKEIIRSVIARQAEFVCLDPYANAFNAAPNSHSHNDETDFYHDFIPLYSYLYVFFGTFSQISVGKKFSYFYVSLRFLPKVGKKLVQRFAPLYWHFLTCSSRKSTSFRISSAA